MARIYPGSLQQRPRKPKQLELGWGGKRPGAGRKAQPDGGVSHNKRPALARRVPVHVWLRVAEDLPTLRRPDVREAIEDCLRKVADLAKERGFQVVHHSIQRCHLHMIVEARDRLALSRGMQGLTIRSARRINKVLGRYGKVFVYRYSERTLKTPKEVAHCIAGLIDVDAVPGTEP